MAAIVPMGMDFWASRRSPERLEPAMIPVSIVVQGDIYKSTVFYKCEGYIVSVLEQGALHCFTCDRWEVYPNQQGEEAGDVSQDVTVGVGSWTFWINV